MSTDWLENLAGGLKRVRLNARSAATLVTNTRCSARKAIDAAGIDKSVLAKQLGHEAQRGQSPFALARGNQFERNVKRDEYMKLLDLLRDFGLDTATIDILDLRDDVPFAGTKADEVLKERAARTREALVEIATGGAPPGRLIDGGALVWNIAGTDVRLETDALAWWLGGQLRVIEIKSFPVEWGQIPADKVSAASWQTAVYVAAIEDLLAEEGLDPGLVSREIFLVCPRNTGLKPVIVRHNVGPQLRLLRRHEARESGIDALAEAVGMISLDVSHAPSAQQSRLLADAVTALMPDYQPSCLATCELAKFCRSRAQSAGEPNAVGSELVQFTTGVRDLRRAAPLLDGAKPKTDAERDFFGLVTEARSAERQILGS